MKKPHPYTLVGAMILMAVTFLNINTASAATTVPGHQRGQWDQDGNGIPDAGVYVTGHYESQYIYDANGDWYWDLGDGRIYGTVASPDLLDQDTLTFYDYVVNYRADFGNDPYMNEGWIQNIVKASGYDYPKKTQFNTFIVSQTDPRYTGDPDFAIWGTWEVFGDIVSGSGIIGPRVHVGGN